MKEKINNTEIRHRSTFAVLFYINRTKVRKDGTCQLLCKISIDAKWEQIGTKVSVNPAIWNPEKGRADGRSENALTVNRAIDDLTKEINEHYDKEQPWIYYGGAGKECRDGGRPETAYTPGSFPGA